MYSFLLADIQKPVSDSLSAYCTDIPADTNTCRNLPPAAFLLTMLQKKKEAFLLPFSFAKQSQNAKKGHQKPFLSF
ncbi:hypothetical protein D3Z53_23825 [Lachnospiraceae bacterium]|nr:hypothetical protein [Lachnospiraceae bacterium]